MNGVVVIVVAAVALIAGYVLYGRWLASNWGIDKSAVTPAHRMSWASVVAAASERRLCERPVCEQSLPKTLP